MNLTLINYEFNLPVTWSQNCIISKPTGEDNFFKTNAKLDLLVLSLLT